MPTTGIRHGLRQHGAIPACCGNRKRIAMEYLEITGAVVGLIYLWLEYRASIWLWLTSIIMPAIYIFVYYDAGFYAYMGLNIYYLAAGIYGWVAWRRKKDSGAAPAITRTPHRYILPLAAVAAAAFAAIAALLVNCTDSPVPYGDAFTTALSIAGLWMLARKYVEQWLVWLVVDVISTILYIRQGLYPTAVLYALYSAIAVAGYFKWLKMMKDGEDAANA